MSVRPITALSRNNAESPIDTTEADLEFNKVMRCKV